ncbi:unnamed protein product [Urochloa humidicola]
MASKRLLIVAVLAVFAAAPALSAGPVIGDCRGRGINVVGKPEGACPLVTSLNSSTYPTGAGFRVSLALGYPMPSACDPAFTYSAVMETAAGVVAACSAADSIVVWASGDGRVAGLNMSGQWWFSSGDQIHLGMKFNVTVLSLPTSKSPLPPRHRRCALRVGVSPPPCSPPAWWHRPRSFTRNLGALVCNSF